MGDTSGECNRFRLMVFNGDILRSISEVGGDKGESSVMETKIGGKPCEKNLMVSGIKGGE